MTISSWQCESLVHCQNWKLDFFIISCSLRAYCIVGWHGSRRARRNARHFIEIFRIRSPRPLNYKNRKLAHLLCFTIAPVSVSYACFVFRQKPDERWTNGQDAQCDLGLQVGRFKPGLALCRCLRSSTAKRWTHPCWPSEPKSLLRFISVDRLICNQHCCRCFNCSVRKLE